MTHPKNHPYFAHALFDFRRSVWLRPKATAEMVQCCKNCLLVIIHCLFPPDSAWGLSWFSLVNGGGYSQTALERDCYTRMTTDVEIDLKQPFI